MSPSRPAGFPARNEENYYSSRRPTGTTSDTGLDVERFDVAAVDDHERRLRELRAERRYLQDFDDLDEDIVGAVC